jgi:hypothetical protein
VVAGPAVNTEAGHRQSGSELGTHPGRPPAVGVMRVTLHGARLPRHGQVLRRLRRTAKRLHVCQEQSLPLLGGSGPAWRRTDITL